MPRLQEVTFAEHAESEVIPAGDPVEAGHAGEDGGGHSGSGGGGGDHFDCEEGAEVAAAALRREQPGAVQAEGGQHGHQGSVCLPCSPLISYATFSLKENG